MHVLQSTKRGRLRSRWLAGILPILLALPGTAHAQDDGARLYMMVPDNTTIASLRMHYLHSDLAVDPGSIAEGVHLNTVLGVFQFVRTLNFGGNQGFIFLVVPASRIKATAHAQSASTSKSISGFGDAQLGFVYGVYGTPALAARDYAEHRPGLAVNLLAKLFFPTGKYSPDRSINIGANRWALRLGVPVVYAIGDGMADPHLTTIEMMPTVTFFGANDQPFEADRAHQESLFIFEGHVTHGITRSLWGSIDLLWREGGSVEVNGVDANNRQRALSLGGTAVVSVGSNMSLRVSYGAVLARNEHGPNGWMARTIFGVVF